MRLAALIASLLLAGCASALHNPCDNPRNMSCMSVSELERALSEQLK